MTTSSCNVQRQVHVCSQKQHVGASANNLVNMPDKLYRNPSTINLLYQLCLGLVDFCCRLSRQLCPRVDHVVQMVPTNSQQQSVKFIQAHIVPRCMMYVYTIFSNIPLNFIKRRDPKTRLAPWV